MRHLQIGSPALLAISLIACDLHRSGSGTNELVLSEGMKISALTPSGKIVIEAGKGFARHFSTVNWSQASVLTPRTTRWYGSLGAYDPAPSSTLSGRLLVDEGWQFFANESEALRYMKYISGYYGPLTYNNSGLVIAYKVIEIPNEVPTRSVAIWQFYINGSKPSGLRGAVDKNIEISGGIIPDKVTPTPAPAGLERELSDKEYTPQN